jgi:hypothetical protein
MRDAYIWLMGKEPQLGDRYRTPDGPGRVVGRSETPPARWLVRVELDTGGFWQGLSSGLDELLEAAGEREFLNQA